MLLSTGACIATIAPFATKTILSALDGTVNVVHSWLWECAWHLPQTDDMLLQVWHCAEPDGVHLHWHLCYHLPGLRHDLSQAGQVSVAFLLDLCITYVSFLLDICMNYLDDDNDDDAMREQQMCSLAECCHLQMLHWRLDAALAIFGSTTARICQFLHVAVTLQLCHVHLMCCVWWTFCTMCVMLMSHIVDGHTPGSLNCLHSAA